MTVPSRTEAAALLLSLNPPAWHVRHAKAVAEVAAWLAARISARDVPIDRRLVEAAALLHDVDKILPRTDPARALRHGAGSATWAERQGAPELAPAIAGHPVTSLATAGGEAWLNAASLESRVVAYADKRAARRLEPMAARFARWERRRRRPWAAPGEVRARAERLERQVCDAADVDPDEVGRLRWVDRALARVQRG